MGQWVAWEENSDGSREITAVFEDWEVELMDAAAENKRKKSISALAALPPGTHLDASGLASLLGVCKKSIERATRRSELPAPFRLHGRNTWLVSAIIKHFEDRQKAALMKQQQHAARLNKAS
jgi:hypothetical protein